MDLRHLVTFCAVVDRGSFSAAAEDLGISQPAVSSQIRSLEERFDVRLLDRRGRGVALTEPGRRFETFARRVIALETELARDLAERDGRIAGRLELGSSTGPGEVLLPRLLAGFRAAHPDVTVSLVVHDTQTICDRVVDGELEVGIVGAARAQRGLTFTPFLRDELVVIVPPDHPFAGRDAVELAELASEPLIMQQRGSGVRAVLEAGLRAAGIRPQDLHVEMELGLQQSAKAAVLDGLGITVISRGSVETEMAEGRLAAVPIAGGGLARDFSLVRATGHSSTRVTDAFLDYARAHLDV